MSLFNLNSKNIKLTVVDADEDLLGLNDCVIEVMVQKKLLKEFLMSLLLVKENSLDNEILLTRRERQVLKYLSLGHNNSQIASNMHISIHTTKVHVHNIFHKLSVQDRTEAVVKAIKYKLIEI